MIPCDCANPLTDDTQAAERRQRLKRLRLASIGLLLFAAALYLVSTAYSRHHPALPYVAAFAEAAMVGALADWFAIVALFRHPLGLPIPHTAIIPRNKLRIACNLGRFIQNNFLSTERILDKIRIFDPATRLADWLDRPQSHKSLGNLAVRALSYGLKTLDDTRLLTFLQGSVTNRILQFDLARISASLLEILTRNGRHHALLDGLLQEINRQLDHPAIREELATIIAGELDFLRYVHLDQATGRFAAEKIILGIRKQVQEIHADPGHPMRSRIDSHIASFINKLREDPDFRQKGEQLKQQLLSHPALGAYVQSLWRQLVSWLQNDLHRTDSRIRAQVMVWVATLGSRLRADRNMQDWINEQVERAVPPLIEAHREKIGQFISEQVSDWDDQAMADRLELNIGADLQYIRLNGTLVGGLVGLAIHAITQWAGF